MASPARKGRGRFVVLQGGAAGSDGSPPRSTGEEAAPADAIGPRASGAPAASANEALALAPSAWPEPIAAVPRSPSSDDELFDRLEVPAAVVCARCGDADCLGCDPDEERSGFLTIVPWERRDGSVFRRLWSTARLATQQPEAFFEALPDGGLGPALRFAMGAELAAATALLTLAGGLGALLLPAFAAEVAARALGFVVRAVFVGLPTVAALLVGAHVLHALYIDRAARKAGARGQRTRALRFGLYAAGWDVVLGPIGLVLLLAQGGPRLMSGVLSAGGNVPGRASRAFLRGAYGVVGEPAQAALRTTFIGAVVATTLAALILFALGAAFVVALSLRI